MEKWQIENGKSGKGGVEKSYLKHKKMHRGDSAIRKWILSNEESKWVCPKRWYPNIPIHGDSIGEKSDMAPHGDKDPMKKDGARNLRSGDVENILPSGYLT